MLIKISIFPIWNKHIKILKRNIQHWKSDSQSSQGFCPKECVLPGSSGAHSACICTKHQNVKRMMAAIVQIFQHYVMDCSPEEHGISTLNGRYEINYICHYMHCLALLQCNPPQEICGNCSTNESFKELITEAFDTKG